MTDIVELRQRIVEMEAYNATRTDEMLAATIRIAELEKQLAGCCDKYSYVSDKRDEALRQVQVLREALVSIQRCDYAARVEGLVEVLAEEPYSDGNLRGLVERRLMHMAQIADEALSEIPSPGVLCESEPVGEMQTGIAKFNVYVEPGTPLYRKKGETPWHNHQSSRK